MKKWLIIAIVVIVGGWLILRGGEKDLVVSADQTIQGNYEVGASERITVQHGARLTVTGNVDIKGTVKCEDGPLTIKSSGSVTITGSIECSLPENSPNNTAIAILASDGFIVGEDAHITSNGHIQVVADGTHLLSSENIDAAYDEAAEDTGTGPRIGPFVEKNPSAGITLPRTHTSVAPTPHSPFSFIATAHAQQPTDKDANVVDNVVIGGTWVIGDGTPPPSGLQIPTPPKKVNKILVYFDFGSNGNLTIKDFHLIGPDGRDGKSDETGSCNARGEKGEDAFRLRVQARTLTLNNFRLELGDGGAGGAATTGKDCDPGIARGGDGGAAGNFKMTASEGISIASFHIVPGVGGQGGSATAYGKDGVDACPGEKGGDARATGGDGGKNKKELAALGAVQGIANVTIDAVEGGLGGVAEASPGKGGNGTGCKCNGGRGGNGTATGGKGGDASLTVVGAAGTANGGDGGDADTHGGTGGTGGSCPLKPSGGNGGKGGDASSKAGAGGKGTTTDGEDGEVKDETGGNGGNGGDGCGPGKGGKGGKGKPPGTDGKDGKLECPEEKKPGTATPPTPPPTGSTPTPTPATPPTPPPQTPPTPPPASQEKVQAIQFNGKYLPVSQLIIEDEVGCGAKHWHAAQGIVIATDGSQVFDPGPQCGFGKVSEKPVIEVSVQAGTGPR